MDYKKLFDLTGKVCIVTGGTGYLGSENCKILKDFGATVVVADIRESEQRWANAPASVGDLFVACDVSSTESIRECFKTVNEKYGKIDVLVNCAAYGAGYGKGSQLDFMDDATWDKGMDGTAGVTFRGMREVIPYMKAQGGGSIINYSSMYGVVSPDLRIYGDNPQKQPPNYGAGKAAVLQVTRYAAGAFGEFGIRVNAITPGPFPNPRNQDDPAFNEQLAKKTMLGRFGQSYEIAGAILLLASDASTFMTGSNITVDGGWTAW
jgi:gluconate 5-dehydrogenase